LFYIDFGDISQFSYFFGIKPLFLYFDVSGTQKQRPNHMRFYEDQFLEGRRSTSQGSAKKEVQGPKG
jgi:hypothetical protein